MDVVKLDVSRDQARKLYAEYKAHRHYSTPVDDEIRKTYREIAKGGVVIQALESIKRAGLNEDGLPRLAIGRADLPHIVLQTEANGGCWFRSESASRMWRRNADQALTSANIQLPPKTFPGLKNDRWRYRAVTPLIPIHLRPRHALDNYHILWEAEWEPIPPKDPYLLRRIGKGDLWLVVAAWDLTEVERAAMATRIQLPS